MLLWGAFERRPGYAVSVGVAWALALPHYAFFLPYARWLSTLIDSPAPDELFRMLLLPFPDLVSPGAFLLALAGLGLWRARREPWARVTGVCWALAWGMVAAYALGLTRHLPFGRNLLLDRFTCVLITPLLALPAAYMLRDRARHVRIASKVLLVLSISSAALPLSDSLSCELPTVPGSADVVAWVKEHRSHDPIVRVEFLLATKRYGKPHNALWVGPRVKGFFAQGDPYFHALTERMEWEGFWWYDPEFVRTVCRLCNIEYLVVSSFPTVKSGMAAGLTPVYKSKWIRVLENRRIAGAEAVDPIGVYDPRSVREVVKEYTTALNLVPKRGYRYIFAVVEDPRELSAFRKVLIRPESPEDVRLAVRLAREGKRVLLVLPAGDDRIAREVSRELGVHPKPAELRLRPRYPKPILPRSLRTTLILKGPKRSEKVPPGYQVGGGWFRDVRVGRGTVRVVGVDLPVVAIRLHPTYVNVGKDLGKIPPLPGPHERRLYSRILDGFGSGLHPIPCRFDPRSARVEVIPSGYQWALVKVKHFPAWHASGGRILVGPGGTMIVRTHSERVILYFAYPTRLYALGAVGFALGALALALRARPDAVLSVIPGQRPESD
ncbi:6-pyruvoyl-tetrahydropterin synthase-related protein [Methanopyrus kandleri]|nr:6-pyruvoyl-tetrahydropterin synthase-related protein [Methanopyrus kandleri]